MWGWSIEWVSYGRGLYHGLWLAVIAMAVIFFATSNIRRKGG